MAIVNVFDRRLKEQLERKGFLFSGHNGDGVDKPIQFTLAGDLKKISKRERPFVELLGKLKKYKEHRYVPKGEYHG